MKIQTKAVHAGDRKKAGAHVPVTTPIYTASSYFYASMEELDRVFGQEDPGYCYARYDNPTNAALEEQAAALEAVLVNALAPLAAHPLVSEVRAGVGVIAGVQLTDQALADRVKARCLEAGFLMRVITGATLQISPPLTTQPSEIQAIVDAIANALDREAGA